MGQDFALVGLHQQHALLAPAHAVQLRVPAKINSGEIESVVECHLRIFLVLRLYVQNQKLATCDPALFKFSPALTFC